MKHYSFLFIIVIFLAILLRVYGLGDNPPSLYWDEASLGYNAFALATAGIDEHGESFPIARFIAFGDYKPPGYIYVAALLIKILGVNELIIRLPSVLSGIGLVVLVYLISQLLFSSIRVSLLSALTVAISPWSIQLSRAAFEANLAAFFNAAGIYLFLLAAKQRLVFLPFSMIFFVASFYTFNANRIIAPIIFFSLSLIYISRLWRGKKILLLTLVLTILLIIPSVTYLKSPESRLRFQEVSIFTDLSVIKEANKRLERENGVWWARIIHNRRVLFAKEYLKHFTDHFNPRYLFISGDVNPRLSVQAVGELYLYELPLLVIGFFALFKKKRFQLALLLIFIIAAIIPAATARETPHALRTASLLPVYQLIIGYGLANFWQKMRGIREITGKRNMLLGVVFFTIIGSWYYYLHYYHIHYPRDWAGEWQDGYKEMVAAVSALEKNYDSVVVTKRWGRPYIYFLLYNRIDPRHYVASRRAERDVFGFWDVYGFDKYYFGSHLRDQLKGKILFVAGPGEVKPQDRILKRIYASSGKVAFVIAER